VSIPVRASRRLAGSGNRVMPMGSPTRRERPSCSTRGATAGAQKSAASARPSRQLRPSAWTEQMTVTVPSSGAAPSHPPGVEMAGGRDYHPTRRGGHEPRSVAWAFVFSADEGVFIG
jgi:hypothetical protein